MTFLLECGAGKSVLYLSRQKLFYSSSGFIMISCMSDLLVDLEQVYWIFELCLYYLLCALECAFMTEVIIQMPIKVLLEFFNK